MTSAWRQFTLDFVAGDFTPSADGHGCALCWRAASAWPWILTPSRPWRRVNHCPPIPHAFAHRPAPANRQQATATSMATATATATAMATAAATATATATTTATGHSHSDGYRHRNSHTNRHGRRHHPYRHPPPGRRASVARPHPCRRWATATKCSSSTRNRAVIINDSGFAQASRCAAANGDITRFVGGTLAFRARVLASRCCNRA